MNSKISQYITLYTKLLQRYCYKVNLGDSWGILSWDIFYWPHGGLIALQPPSYYKQASLVSTGFAWEFSLFFIIAHLHLWVTIGISCLWFFAFRVIYSTILKLTLCTLGDLILLSDISIIFNISVTTCRKGLIQHAEIIFINPTRVRSDMFICK